MQIQICQKNPKKNRHIEHYRCCARLDVAAQQGETFASQNSRQKSENPRMDFRFLASLCLEGATVGIMHHKKASLAI